MRDRILRTLHAGAPWEVGFSGRSALSRDPILTTLRADRILRMLRMEAPCGNRWRTRNAPEHVPKRTWARAETHPARTRAADPKRTLPGPKWFQDMRSQNEAVDGVRKVASHGNGQGAQKLIFAAERRVSCWTSSARSQAHCSKLRDPARVLCWTLRP